MFVQIVVVAVGAAFLLSALAVATFVFEYVRHKRGVYKIDPGPLAGFSAKRSYTRGEPISLYIHAKTPATLTTQRLGTGWTPVGAPVPVPRHLQSGRYSRDRGFAWTSTLTIESADLAPGLYRLLLELDGGDARFSIPVIIKGETVQPLCVVLATHTWEAYSAFGGVSRYENHHVSGMSKAIARLPRIPNQHFRSNFVPSARPNQLFSVEVETGEFGEDYSSFTIRNELEFLVFLAKSGMPFSVYCDDDLAEEPKLREAKALIFPGHSEYWTDAMIYTLERYIRNGGSVYFSDSGVEGQCAVTVQELAGPCCCGRPRRPFASRSISEAEEGTDRIYRGSPARDAGYSGDDSSHVFRKSRSRTARRVCPPLPDAHQSGCLAKGFGRVDRGGGEQ